MWHLLHALWSALIGAALSVVGLIQSVQAFPAAIVWQTVIANAQPLLAVSMFIGCVVLVILGFILFVRAVRAISYHRRILASRRPRQPWQHDDDEPDYDPAWAR